MSFIQELKNNLNYSLNFVGRPFYNFSKVFSFFAISFVATMVLYFIIEYLMNYFLSNNSINYSDTFLRGIELCFSINIFTIYFIPFMMYRKKNDELIEFDISNTFQSINYKVITVPFLIVLLFYFTSRMTTKIEMSDNANALETLLSLFGKPYVTSTIELWITIIFDFGKYIIPGIVFVHFLQYSDTKKVSFKFNKQKRKAIWVSILIHTVITIFATSTFDLIEYSFFSICRHFEFYSYLTILVSLLIYCTLWSFVITLCAATLYFPWQTKLQTKQLTSDELLDAELNNE